MADSCRIVALGGLGEVGKNMMVFDCDGSIVVVDAGLAFPRDEHLGVDLVLPDFAYLRERARDVRAVILTHGHEDHVGALPYLLREIPVPEVWATRSSARSIRTTRRAASDPSGSRSCAWRTRSRIASRSCSRRRRRGWSTP